MSAPPASEPSDVDGHDAASEPSDVDGHAAAGDGVDGRTARRDRNRTAVLDATLALFTEGHLTPTAPQVAERSGVSLRSVYRYFEDREGLTQAAIDHHWHRVSSLLAFDDLGEGTLEERIDALVARRLTLFETVAPVARVAVVRAVTNESVRRLMEERRRRLSEQVDAQFAPELDVMAPDDRRRCAAALDLLLSMEGLDYLAVRRQLPRGELADLLRAGVVRLLA